MVWPCFFSSKLQAAISSFSTRDCANSHLPTDKEPLLPASAPDAGMGCIWEPQFVSELGSRGMAAGFSPELHRGHLSTCPPHAARPVYVVCWLWLTGAGTGIWQLKRHRHVVGAPTRSIWQQHFGHCPRLDQAPPPCRPSRWRHENRARRIPWQD